jgi:hypothetical protein
MKSVSKPSYSAESGSISLAMLRKIRGLPYHMD